MTPIEQLDPRYHPLGPSPSEQILAWFDQHGRKDLPWQQPITPYRVWLSEIMLQQTQVTTVIDYFQRFTTRFPTLNDLAQANENEVLALWAGLGYYARARHLLRTARLVAAQHQGELPDTLEALIALPGIGRSTAGAILAIAFQTRAPILDGNVKRVLCRYFGLPGWPGETENLKRLWAYAEQLTPHARVADYTQAIMDLGATLCTRNKPACPRCPLQQHCKALQHNIQTELPGRKPKKHRPNKAVYLLLLQHNQDIFLYQRPSDGLWGGLWCLPDYANRQTVKQVCQALNPGATPKFAASFQHGFTHFQLTIHPVILTLSKKIVPNLHPHDAPKSPLHPKAGAQRVCWAMPTQLPGGLPRPVARILKSG